MFDHEKQCTGLECQFNLLSQVTPDPDNVYCSTAKNNKKKNRSVKYLPRMNCSHLVGKLLFIIS